MKLRTEFECKSSTSRRKCFSSGKTKHPQCQLVQDRKSLMNTPRHKIRKLGYKKIQLLQPLDDENLEVAV